MANYIDREKAIKAIRNYADIKHINGDNIIYINGILKAISILSELPNADVVFCKECIHKVLTDDGEYCPFDIVCDYHMSDGFDENDFCSRGKRGTYGGNTE